MGQPTKWTFDALKASADSYTELKQWRISEPSAYATACARKLLPKLTHHMSKAIHHGYWTPDRISKSALSYKHKSHWAKAEPGAPQAAKRLGIYEQVTAHMEAIGNKNLRCVYVITVRGTDIIYVGLTGNPKRRFNDHLKTKRFIRIAKKYGRHSINFQKLTDYLPIGQAQIAEQQVLNEYTRKGFKALNKAKTGGLGGTDLIWTDKAIFDEALRYKSLKNWREKSPSSYSAAVKKGILANVSDHMERLFEEKWDKISIFENAKKFEHKVRWKEAFPGAVLASRRLGIYRQATSHMVPLSERGKWTKAAVIEQAQKYRTKSEWHKKSTGSYEAALRGGYIEEATSHMENKKVHVWTEELLRIEKQKYKNIDEWKIKSKSSFLAAQKLSMFGLKSGNKREAPRSKWDLNSVRESALKFNSRSEWKRAAGGAYTAAVRNGWIEQVTSHMAILHPIGRWNNKSAIIDNAKKYQTKSAWMRNSAGAYEAAKRLKCFEEATAHMQIMRMSWNEDKINSSMKGFTDLQSWRDANPNAYAAAHRLGILQEITNKLPRKKRVNWKKSEILASVENFKTFKHWRLDSAPRYMAARQLGLLEYIKNYYKN